MLIHEAMGCFRAAHGGTIFLDEIGELDLDSQAKLLRVLQERQVTPVGSHQPVPVDARLIAATNRDLEHEVRQGRFRLDLFYRLNVLTVDSLGLAERQADIPALVQHFLAKASVEAGLPHCQITDDAMRVLLQYDWPGNIRELQNLIERAVVTSDGDTISSEAFPEILERLGLSQVRQSGLKVFDAKKSPEDSPASDVATSLNNHGWQKLADVERDHIVATLEKTYFNQSAAARLLGVDRKLLARKIKKHNIALARSCS